MSFTSNNNNINYSTIYEPITLTGKLSYFNFSISSCYKTCSDCNNILGSNKNHFCSNCSDEYPIIYLNGEKCVSSCDEIDLYEYKNECINKSNDNKDNNFINELTTAYYNTYTEYINKSNDNKDATFINELTNTYYNNYTEYINKSNDSKDNTFINELTNAYYDNSTGNKNDSKTEARINTYQNIWVEICPEEYIYKYEFNEKCYSEKIDKFIQTCYISEFLKGVCIINNENNENNNNNNPEEKDIMVSNIRKLIKDFIIPDIFEGENKGIIIKDTDIIYQIIPFTNQKNCIKDNISTIYFGECEKKLKQHNNINEDESLIMFKLDIYKRGSRIPIEYEVYDLKTKNQLNLNICNDTKIQILIPVSIEEKNINKYNSSDDYYNDICYTYTTEKGTDIILTDRKNEYIDNNMSICETKCEYEGYELDSMKAKCECEVKIKIPYMSEIIINKDILMNKLDIKNSLNIKILKCYKLLFSKDGLKENIGSYVMLSIIFINTICLILFLIKDYHEIIDIIYKIVSYNKNKRIKANRNSFINKNNKKKKNESNLKSNKKKKKKKNERKSSLVISNNKIEQSNIKIKDNNMGHSPPKKKVKTNRIINYYINYLQTKVDDLNANSSYKLNKKDKRKDKIDELNISKINNKKDNIKMLLKYNDYEINDLTYKEAIKFDKRGYIDYYFSLLRRKQILIFTFYTCDDYNSKMIKICVFFFSFALQYTVNALFFSDIRRQWQF